MKTYEIAKTGKPLNYFPSFGSVPDSNVQGAATRTISASRLPSLEEMLMEVMPLPKEALFVGQAQDKLPVFLNLSDPTPGPILIVGDSDAGKTNFLKVLACSAIATHSLEEIQFGVFTNQPSEWCDLENDPRCVGIFPICQNYTAKFIRSLITWIDKYKLMKPVLLFIDGIECIELADNEFNSSLCKVLSDGPALRVWPIATVDPSKCKNTNAWLKMFHTHLFGYTHIERNAAQLVDKPCFDLEKIVKGVQFGLKEGKGWIKFWVPTARIAPGGEG